MSDIHSCSYYCDRPACIKSQRDELRDRLEAQPTAEQVREECAKVADRLGYGWTATECAAAIRALDLSKIGGE